MAEKENKSDKVEREYTIPLRREWNKVPQYKRAKKAIRAIREFLAQHMKVRDRDLNKIKVDRFLNEEVWFRGIKNPPSKIKVKAVKEGDIVRAELAVLPNALKFKKAREERREAESLAASSKSQSKAEKIATEVGKKNEVEHKPVEEKAEAAEKRIVAEEKKENTIEAMEKFEKQEGKKMKQQKGGKMDKMEQVQTKKKDLKSR